MADSGVSTEHSFSRANTATSLIGTILGLALSTASADFLTPFLVWLPKLLLALFIAIFLLSLTVMSVRRRPMHWISYASGFGVLFAVALLGLAWIKTPPGQKSVGALSATVPAVRAVQQKLPLDPAARSTIATLDRQPQSKAQSDAAPAVPLPAPQPRPDPEYFIIARLSASLTSSAPQTREGAAESALAQSQSSPATFRRVLRALLRTNNPALQEIAILHELKSLEGKQIPLTVSRAPETGAENAAASSDVVQQLTTLLVGTSLKIEHVDLASSSFTGGFNSDNVYPVGGSVTSRGVDLTARVGNPFRESYPMEMTLHPSADLQLTGEATVTLKSGPASYPVGLDLPF